MSSPFPSSPSLLFSSKFPWGGLSFFGRLESIVGQFWLRLFIDILLHILVVAVVVVVVFIVVVVVIDVVVVVSLLLLLRLLLLSFFKNDHYHYC